MAQNGAMARPKAAMSAARRGPGANRSSTKLKPPLLAADDCGVSVAAVTTAPWPRSVGVKLPWPKYGNTACPVTAAGAARRPGAVTVTDRPTLVPAWRSTEVPSAISSRERGARPASKVGDISAPRPGARPMAGTTCPPTCTVPCTPKVQPVRPGTCAVMRPNCGGVMTPKPRSTSASQSWPYSRGVSTRCSRFAPKVTAAATVATDRARPARALRTGTAVRP